MTIGQNKPRVMVMNKMMRARRNALLAVGSDEEETRRRRESSSDRKFFVTHAFIRCTFYNHFTLSCFNYVRKILLVSLTHTARKNHSKNHLSNKNSIMKKT